MSTPDFATIARELLNEQSPPEDEEPIDARVLDATLRLVGEYGERRLTMDDIAAASKVARATLFRRFGGKDALVTRLYMRELRRSFAATRAAVDGAEDPLATGFATLTAFCCEHPVTRQIARAEPDLMVALWRAGDPPGIAVVRMVLEELAGADRAASDTLARLMFSYLMIPEGAPGRDTLEAQARVMADSRHG